jgi:hypothetical protein
VQLEDALRVEQNRDWAVVDEFDLHVGAKLAVLHGQAEPCEFASSPFVKIAGQRFFGCGDERWTASFARVAVECELRDE